MTRRRAVTVARRVVVGLVLAVTIVAQQSASAPGALRAAPWPAEPPTADERALIDGWLDDLGLADLSVMVRIDPSDPAHVGQRERPCRTYRRTIETTGDTMTRTTAIATTAATAVLVVLLTACGAPAVTAPAAPTAAPTEAATPEPAPALPTEVGATVPAADVAAARAAGAVVYVSPTGDGTGVVLDPAAVAEPVVTDLIAAGGGGAPTSGDVDGATARATALRAVYAAAADAGYSATYVITTGLYDADDTLLQAGYAVRMADGTPHRAVGGQVLSHDEALELARSTGQPVVDATR